MNQFRKSIMALLAFLLLSACSERQAALATPAPGVPPVTLEASPVDAPQAALTVPAPADGAEEAQVRSLVVNFGKQLQLVSLQSPNASQEMQQSYGEFVSPALLQTWLSDASKAPGRLVSSPWPDRIEITTLVKEAADRYAVTGFVIEVTSLEAAGGGAPNRIPLRLLVQKIQGRWVITEYAEER